MTDRRPNVLEPEFEESDERPGFGWRGAWVGHHAGADRLGASVYELAPGQAAFPYHWHAANEEMLIVLQGSPSLRGPDGWRELLEGEVVAFPRGARGAHQVANRGQQPVRVLMLSEMRGPDICPHVDSEVLGVREAPPGSGKPGLSLNLPAGAAVDYWYGEAPQDDS